MPKKFKKIFIEITNHCNLSCIFCHQSKRQKSWMSPDDFTQIVEKTKTFTNHLALHVLGEPLLHPDLDRLLAQCQRHNMAVNLTTNGTLLPQCQDLLFGSPALRQVNISLHSAAEMPPGPALSNYLTGIFDFIQQARTSKPLYICLRLWNLQEAKANDSSRQNEPILQNIEEFFDLPIRLADTLTPGQGITLAPNVFLSQNSRFTWPHASTQELSDVGFCRGIRDHVAILVDGTVVPCCLDAEADIKLGNIYELSLEKILAGTRATTLYDGFSQHRIVEDLCRRCRFRQPFLAK